MKKRVAVTCGSDTNLAPYEDALRAVGLEPVRNPETLEGLDGLLLPGGTDVDPALYGETMDPRTEAPDTNRDALEMRLVNEALAADLPVLGICRGLQLLNVAHGGTLIQHLPNTEDHRVRPPDASSDIHTVSVAEETRLAAIEGAGERPVNSRHHQAIDRVGEGLRVSAVATGDGVIEAVERPDRKFAVAVQWHAEDRFRRDSRDQRLFEAFAAAMQK